MKAADIPVKIPLPFATNANPSNTRQIPETTTDPNAASYNLGFPPPTFAPIGAGGVPPDGKDFNGLNNQQTAWLRWAQAGAPVQYDSAFATDPAVNGYPKGAILSGAILGQFWLNLVDDNATNPDTGGANWQSFYFPSENGQCQLNYGSPTVITLIPVDGNLVRINGPSWPIPAGGVTAANTNVYVDGVAGQNLAASTTYYVGVGIVAGVMTLGFFSKASYSHLPDTTAGNVGVEVISSGGAPVSGWSLVGMAQTSASSVFQEDQRTQGVISWFNKRPIQLVSGVVNAVLGTSNAEISTNFQVKSLVWGNTPNQIVPPSATSGGGLSLGAAGTAVFLQGYRDGSPVGNQLVLSFPGTGANVQVSADSSSNDSMTEGWHVWTLYGSTTIGSPSTVVNHGYTRVQVWG
jgi:hypothetical protein